jgi:hypothetical protein
MVVMAVAGPALAAITLVANVISGLTFPPDVAALDIPRPRTTGAADLIAQDLVAELATKDAADDAAANQIVPWARLVSNLALGFALVLIGVNAMRAGLLSRVMGILAIVVGVLSVLFQGAGLFAGVWLVALGSLLLNRWPGQRGPAWETGEAIPWPSASARPDEPADEEDEQEDVGPEPEPEIGDDEEPAATPHPASKKRRKKKRR